MITKIDNDFLKLYFYLWEGGISWCIQISFKTDFEIVRIAPKIMQLLI